MPGYFELKQNDKQQYWFTVKAGNGASVLRSEQYESKAAAEGGIASVQKNCAEEARYERKDAADGRCYFNLKAANHQVIGTSPMFDSPALRDAAIVSVKIQRTIDADQERRLRLFAGCGGSRCRHFAA